jgi:Spy/CpxP family protein refolding chaperone
MDKKLHLTRAGAWLCLLVLIVTGPLRSQVPPDRDALLNGDDNGMAACAESNGYPGPKHVLDLAERLALTARQKHDLREIYDDMNTRARALGKMIVKIEEELNYAFNSGMLSQESAADDAESVGKMRGTLRGVHLSAHIRTKELLTKKQLEQYAAFRKEQMEKENDKAGHP